MMTHNGAKLNSLFSTPSTQSSCGEKSAVPSQIWRVSMPLQDYGNTSVLDKLKIFLTLCRLPVALALRLILSPFRTYDQHRSWRRVVSDESFRFFSSHLRVNQMQYIMSTTPEVYTTWARKKGRSPMIDDLKNGGSLMWFTDRRTSGKVVFYLHGGTYQLPMQDYAPPFWLTVLNEIVNRTGEDFGLVALSYSLYPSAPFPTQLLQASVGLSHLLSSGIKFEDIHLVGDSAGSALVLQVISHILHPHPDVPRISLSGPLGGAYLMSPWVSLTTETLSFKINSARDALSGDSWAYLASGIVENLTEGARPYLEAIKAPRDWWGGVNEVVKRITIHTGELECLRDVNIALASTLKDHHPNVVLFVQPGGVHVDPYLSRLAGEEDNKGVMDCVLGHFLG